MRHLISLALVSLAACVGTTPPSPELTVTSPTRGMYQASGDQIVVHGTARPGADGAAIARVTVNGAAAKLAADGSFTATLTVPSGTTLLETTATTAEGGTTTDARAVQFGAMRPLGTRIERAVTAALSAEAFTKLAATAGPLIKSLDLNALLASMQPIASFGDSLANVAITTSNVKLGNVVITMTPVAGGLRFGAEIDNLAVTAKAAYAGTLVPDGATTIAVTGDHISFTGTLSITPSGAAGFLTKVASPAVKLTNLKLQASGTTGAILSLLTNNLGSLVQDLLASTTECALQPMIGAAMGALDGPQNLDILGHTLDLQASPSAVSFSTQGALVTMDLQAKFAGSESSSGFIFNPNGTPTVAVGKGVQIALADDLVNEMLASAYAIGLLDIHLAEDFGGFDAVDIKLMRPPMLSANTTDGSTQLVLGDMIATLRKGGKPQASAAINAQVAVQVLPGTKPEEIALKFGQARLFVNLLDNPDGAAADDVADAASTGLSLQLDSLSQLLVTVPIPQVAGITFDNLAVRGDQGYIVVSGDIH